MERKEKEQPKIAIDGTEHTVRSTDNKVLHRKLISTLYNFQRSPKMKCHLININLETQRKVRECVGENMEDGGRNIFRIKTECSESRIGRGR